MRCTFALTLFLIGAIPAYGQIEDDFAIANRMLGQVSAASVVNEIDGEWLPLTTLSNLDGRDPDPGLISSLLDRICGNAPARGMVITEIDMASFEMAAPNSDGELVYRFDWTGGSQFLRSVDPASLFSALGLDTIEGERGVEVRARTLNATSQFVNFYRISPDVLAMAEPKRVEIFARCP